MPTPNTLRNAYLAPVICLTTSGPLTTANNAQGSAIDFTQANANIEGYRRGYWVLAGTAFGTAPVVNTGMSIYLARSIDGTTGNIQTLPATTVANPALPISATIPFDGSTDVSAGAWKLTSAEVDAPGVPCVVVLVNNSGQPLPTGSTLSWVPVTSQTNGSN